MSGPLRWDRAHQSTRAWTSGRMARNSSSVRITVHDTENTVGTNPANIASYLWRVVGAWSGYHLLMPLTSAHKPFQQRPFDVSAAGLRNNGSGPTSPNKTGIINIQVALICFARDREGTKGLGPWWEPFLDEVARRWGVPDVIVGGHLPPGGGRINPLSMGEMFGSQSGWMFHATARNPASSHWDPGRVNTGVLFGGDPTIPPPVDKPPEFDPDPRFHRNLSVKSPFMRGRDVTWVQIKVGSKADGIYGNDTRGAVTDWQRRNGQSADGVVGPNTASAMGMPGAPAVTPPPSTFNYEVRGSGTVSIKMIKPTSPIMKGRDVTSVQHLLASHGHNPGKIDGQYGGKSQGACKAFQKSKGLGQDAWVGAKTFDRLVNG